MRHLPLNYITGIEDDSPDVARREDAANG